MQILTARDLIRHHEARASIYGALAAWLQGVPAHVSIGDSVVHGARALLPRLADADAAAPRAAVRAMTGSTAALRILALLAGESAHALKRGDLSGAAALMLAQSAFIDAFAGPLLRQTCGRLSTPEDPTLHALATTLGALLDDDASASRQNPESPAGDGVTR